MRSNTPPSKSKARPEAASDTGNTYRNEVRPFCPHCEQAPLRRNGRAGFWQTAVLPKLGYYPWECALCRRLFYLRQRTQGKEEYVLEEMTQPLQSKP